jgi:hypothetical protein
MKLALFALVAISVVGCTRSTIESTRETFEPTKRKGAWAQYERDARNQRDPGDPTKRALFREVD